MIDYTKKSTDLGQERNPGRGVPLNGHLTDTSENWLVIEPGRLEKKEHSFGGELTIVKNSLHTYNETFFIALPKRHFRLRVLKKPPAIGIVAAKEKKLKSYLHS